MSESFDLQALGDDEALSEGVMPDHLITSGKEGPTIMVIGDSFTASYFPAMLSLHAGRAIWVHHHQCAFDWKLIDRFHPDEVWWTPTERFLVCDLGAHPLDFLGVAAMTAPPRPPERP